MEEIILNAKSEVKQLIFLFHGYGTDAENLKPIGERFSEAILDAEVHLPQGLEYCPESFGRRWFPLEGDDIVHWGDALQRAESSIMSYIDEVKKAKGLDNNSVIMAGFSQGAMLSLSLGVYHEMKAVISFSGLFLAPEKYLKKSDTRVLLAHGSGDDVVPFSSVELTEEMLKTAGIHCEKAISAGLGHAIDETLLNKAVDFLRRL